MDLAVVIRGVEALTGEVPIVCVNVAALSIDNLKFYASQRLSGLLIQLADNQRTGGTALARRSALMMGSIILTWPVRLS